jgi:hypothetical protein
MRSELSNFLNNSYNNIIGFCPVATIHALDYLEKDTWF